MRTRACLQPLRLSAASAPVCSPCACLQPLRLSAAPVPRAVCPPPPPPPHTHTSSPATSRHRNQPTQHKIQPSAHWQLVNLSCMMNNRTADCYQTSIGNARWRSWFGARSPAVVGPFNTGCPASDYGPPVIRTCCLKPQLNPGIVAQPPLSDACLARLEAMCGSYQGDNPVAGKSCSQCLTANFSRIRGVCPGTSTAVTAFVDMVYCY